MKCKIKPVFTYIPPSAHICLYLLCSTWAWLDVSAIPSYTPCLLTRLHWRQRETLSPKVGDTRHQVSIKRHVPSPALLNACVFHLAEEREGVSFAFSYSLRVTPHSERERERTVETFEKSDKPSANS